MITALYQQIILAGLPEPELERRVCAERRWRWDLFFDAGIAVEFQGGTWIRGGHNRGKQYESDCCKLNEGQLQGLIVLWVTTDMVKDGRALAAIERALAARRRENEGLCSEGD